MWWLQVIVGNENLREVAGNCVLENGNEKVLRCFLYWSLQFCKKIIANIVLKTIRDVSIF